MSIEIISMVGTKEVSESRSFDGPQIDADYLTRFARPPVAAGSPLYFGGASDAAVGVGAEHADVLREQASRTPAGPVVTATAAADAEALSA